MYITHLMRTNDLFYCRIFRSFHLFYDIFDLFNLKKNYLPTVTRNVINNYLSILSVQVEVMEQQIKEMTLSISDYEDKKQQLENDLKASIDKIFVLREIIAELEKQVETKSANENVLTDKVKVRRSRNRF